MCIYIYIYVCVCAYKICYPKCHNQILHYTVISAYSFKSIYVHANNMKLGLFDVWKKPCTAKRMVETRWNILKPSKYCDKPLVNWRRISKPSDHSDISRPFTIVHTLFSYGGFYAVARLVDAALKGHLRMAKNGPGSPDLRASSDIFATSSFLGPKKVGWSSWAFFASC